MCGYRVDTPLFSLLERGVGCQGPMNFAWKLPQLAFLWEWDPMSQIWCVFTQITHTAAGIEAVIRGKSVVQRSPTKKGSKMCVFVSLAEYLCTAWAGGDSFRWGPTGQKRAKLPPADPP